MFAITTLFRVLTTAPYIESELIEGIVYFFIIPTESIFFVFFIYKFLQKKIWGVFLVAYLLFAALFSYFSLKIMGWPTYWFASNNETLYVEGAGIFTKKGIKEYNLYLVKSDGDSLYTIEISKKIYDTLIKKCKSKHFPIISKVWWAGNAIPEKRLTQAIAKSCFNKKVIARKRLSVTTLDQPNVELNIQLYGFPEVEVQSSKMLKGIEKY